MSWRRFGIIKVVHAHLLQVRDSDGYGLTRFTSNEDEGMGSGRKAMSEVLMFEMRR